MYKTIEGFEGIYEVSEDGTIKSLDRITKGRWGDYLQKGRIRKHAIVKNGYHQIELIDKNKKHHHKLVHRLVAEAFIPNPDNLPEVHHIDEDKDNNHVSNLMWVTRSENVNAGTRTERVTNKLSKAIIQYKDGVEVATYSSIRRASNELNIPHSNIVAVLTGVYQQTHGFTFKYLKVNS